MMIPKFRAWYTPFKGEKHGQKMKYGSAGSLITHAEMSPDKYTLMQSTGLNDKNGVEIYVGDIVKGEQWLTTTMPAWIVDQVSYSERSTMFYLGSANEIHNRFMHSLGNTIYQYEVIGNIHENPELLSSGIE